MELILIRHGLPVTITGADGPADPPLSETGLEQAARMASWMSHEKIDRLYSSPMKRAMQTAAPLAETHGLEIEQRDGVAEFDRTHAEYIPNEKLRELDYERWKQRMQDGWYGEGDPLDFRTVVVDAVEAIIAENPGGRVAVVCHGGIVNAYASQILGLPKVFFFQPTYTSINRFQANRSGVRTVVSLNEAAHLELPEVSRIRFG